MTLLKGTEDFVSAQLYKTANREAKKIADKIIPSYRLSGKSYSCTGTIAKKWQAAYEGACMAYGVEP